MTMFTWHITWRITDTMLHWYLSIAWFAFCLPQNASVVFQLYHCNIFSINSLLCLFDVALTSSRAHQHLRSNDCHLTTLSQKVLLHKFVLSDILRFGILLQIYSHQDFNCLSQMKWQYFQSIPIDIQFSSSHKSHSEVHVKADFFLEAPGMFLKNPVQNHQL